MRTELKNTKGQLSQANQQMEVMRASLTTKEADFALDTAHKEARWAELDQTKVQLNLANQHIETMKASLESKDAELARAHDRDRATEDTKLTAQKPTAEVSRLKERAEMGGTTIRKVEAAREGHEEGCRAVAVIGGAKCAHERGEEVGKAGEEDDKEGGECE